MKSQGLPINFIVLIAIGVFVLILVILFFLSGSQQTSAVTQQSAYNACNSKCSAEVQYAQMGGTYPKTSAPFCNIAYTIPGIGTNVRCNAFTSCKVNDTCTLFCSTSTAGKACCNSNC